MLFMCLKCQSLPLVCRCCTLVAAQRVIGICRLRVPEDDIMYSFSVFIPSSFDFATVALLS